MQLVYAGVSGAGVLEVMRVGLLGGLQSQEGGVGGTGAGVLGDSQVQLVYAGGTGAGRLRSLSGVVGLCRRVRCGKS